MQDALVEGDETVRLTLSAPTGATLGASSTATLTITDDDAAPPPPPPSGPGFVFASVTFSTREDYGGATIVVTRSSGKGKASVAYATAGGTATAGADYTATSGRLSFASGQTSKSFRVYLRNDNTYEGTETIQTLIVGRDITGVGAFA